MSLDRKTSLRVLYTVNASYQYILAKSHTRVPITVVPVDDGGSPNTSNAQPLYASVLLKTCLDTIRRSSPELTHDRNRDFAIYVLDPLESHSAPAPVNISNASGDSSSSNNAGTGEHPKGVAVAHGLMSWALAADSEATAVNGTLVKQANGQEALEVICALRETVAMQKPMWNVPSSSSQPSSSQETTRIPKVESIPNYPFLSQSSSISFQSVHLTSSFQNRSLEDLTRETLASKQTRSKPRVKPPRPVKPSTTPSTESDKLMIADTYIGPFKKKGRPKATGPEIRPEATSSSAAASGSTSTSSRQPKEVIVIDGSDSDGAAPTPTASSFSTTTSKPPQYKRRASQQPKGSPFTTEPLVRRVTNPEPVAPPTMVSQTTEVKTEPQEEPNLLGGILSYLSAASSPEPSAQNTAILAALNTIDSSGKSEENASNPALIAALRQLLTAYASNTPSDTCTPAPAVPSSEPPKYHHRSSSSSQDDSIVILDKENVNPAAFQKKSEKECQALKSSASLPVIPSSSSSSSSQPSHHSDRQVQSLGPSARSNSNPSLRPSLTDSSIGSSSDKTLRKRTLSDFMDERENKSKGKGKERERSDKRDGHRHTQFLRPPPPPRPTPIFDSLRHYPRLAASNLPRTEPACNNYYRLPLESVAMTSPARPRPDLENRLSMGENAFAEGSASGSRRMSTSPRGTKVSASSPVRGSRNEARKKYVVPEWARTNTSTQPRLSEEAQRALEEAEERKKRERRAARKRLPSVQAKLKAKEAAKSGSETDQQVEPLAPPPLPAAKADVSRGPLTVNDRPMVAAADITFPFVSSSRPSSPPPQPRVIARTPKTPSRERHHPRPTPGAENDSLFTPVMGSGSLFGSAHSYTRRTPMPPPSILTSPLGNRKKARLTPTRSMLTGKAFSVLDAWTSSSTPSSDPKAAEEEGSPNISLDKELEDALEDLDCPPSSLPIASSDIDVDEGHADPSQEGEEGTGDDAEVFTVKQHWPGLPPSSPPPPSSPMLLPEFGDNDVQDDDDMADLPVATSDSETDTEMNEMTGTETDNITSPDDIQSPIDPLENQTGYQNFFMQQDFATTITTSEFPNSSELFEQYTNINEHSEFFTGIEGLDMSDPNLGALIQNGLDTIDFTEFWETFKPMVNDSMSMQPSQGVGGGFDMGMGQDGLGGGGATFGEIDHAKLADDVQSLFSGCLM